MPSALRLAVLVSSFFLISCADTRHRIYISAADQKMAVYDKGNRLGTFAISTSKFALSSDPGSNGTPLGNLAIAKKIGDGQPLGMKFKSRVPTGEIVPVDAPGRDPIVTRILWLKGLDSWNKNTYDRYIYIHGTPEERNLGRPVSYGCVRMRSVDVAWLYDQVGKGARVNIFREPLEWYLQSNPPG